MKKEKKISLKIGILLLIGTCLGTGFLWYHYFNYQYQKNIALQTSSTDLKRVQELYDDITSQYVKDIDKDKLIEGALKGMTDAIGDPYSNYLNKADAHQLQETLSSSMEGIGAVLTIKEGYPIIAEEPKENTPAHKASLKKEDQILKVDGVSTKNQPLDVVVQKIKGKKGSKVTLTIQRKTKVWPVTLKREKIVLHSVAYQTVGNDISWIKIQQFSKNTAKEVQQAIEKGRKKGNTRILLDVRQNPGGLLEQVSQIASMFLKDDQVILSWKDHKKNKVYVKANSTLDQGFKVTEPTAILVDQHSASASEILAGALKDHHRGVVIGQKTYGKGSMQNITEKGEDQLKLTTGLWYTPKGLSINEKGLEPEIKVDYPRYAYYPPLNESFSFQLNDQNEVIKIIHCWLRALGYTVPEENKFSEQTKQSLLSLQKEYHLKETGQWNSETNEQVQRLLLEKMKKEDSFLDKGIEILNEKNN